MIFTVLQLQKKCQEIRSYNITFVNLTVAFDAVNRDGLWKIMHKLGSPKRSTHMVRELHDGVMVCVTDKGQSERHSRWNGGVFDLTLFSLMFSALLTGASRNERPGIRIVHGTEGRHLNNRCMQVPTRIPTTVYDLNLADDFALNTTTKADV
nr:unnamed protein product [Spirometra erinaceieuropaei]